MPLRVLSIAAVLFSSVPVVQAVLDDDGNGLSDVWEAAYGRGWALGSDQDGDGARNREESLAGTDPENPSSVFAVANTEVVGSGTLRLRWPTLPGKVYRLAASYDLASWFPLTPYAPVSGTMGQRDVALSAIPMTPVSAVRWTGSTANFTTVRNDAAVNRPADEIVPLPVFEVPQTSPNRDWIAHWVRGWLVPKSTGTYTFWVASDDSSELYLSTNSGTAGKALIASVNGWTSYRQWGKYASQRSSPQLLQANTPYFFEFLHREGAGGDHFSVAWTGPGLDPDKEIIKAEYLTGEPQTLAEGSQGKRLYFRVEVSDADSDGDGVTDYEELLIGYDPHSPTTVPRVPDLTSIRNRLGAANVVTVGVPAARAYEIGGIPGRFTVYRSGNVNPLAVRYQISGSAVPGGDYTALSGTAFLPVGAASVDISVAPRPDDLLEPAESVTIEILPSATYAVGNPARGTVMIDDAEDVLYVASLRGSAGLRSGGFGSAVLRVAGNRVFAVLSLAFGNLTAAQAGAEVFVSSSGNVGPVVWDLGSGQIPSRRWDFTPANGLTSDQIREALQEGRLWLRVASLAYPGGEILGRFVREQGWQEMPIPPEPPPAPTVPTSAGEISRFLSQTTFGPTSEEIAAFSGISYAAWLDAQFALPATKHLPYVQARRAELLARDPDDDGWQGPRQEAWWQRAMFAPDQLRQRMAFALSQILVVSDVGVLEGSHEGITNYYDLLLEGAFGNYRYLLEAVTLSPIMGQYLSMARNRKPDPVTGSEPDENYAREIMQLFTIGLNRLHPDGSLMLDAEGRPIPTYTQDDIVGLAHVFTGWGFGYDPANPPSNLRNYFLWGQPDEMRPMVMYPEFHDNGEKRILNGLVIPAGQTGEQDLTQALDALFQHPNLGPFVARQLIQRFVTSNPSPGYVYRVARAFADNGQGVRGDLRATLRALLLDYEARSPAFFGDAGYGKQREPLLRMAHLLRAFKAAPPVPGDPRLFLNLQYSLTHQAPLKSPSVFNFFQPGYIQPGAIAAAGLLSPEFQITSETTVINQINNQHAALFWGLWTREKNAAGENVRVYLNFSEETAILMMPGTPQDRQQALLEHLNIKLLGGRMSTGLRQQIMEAYAALPGWFDDRESYQRERVKMAIYLIFASPEYVIEP